MWNSAGRRFLKLVKHWKIYLRKMRHNYLLLLLTFRPSFPPSFFSFSSEQDIHQHLFVSGFVKNTLTSVINMIRIKFTVLIFRFIVREVILKVFLKFRRGNDDHDRNWIYSSATEVISNANLLVSPLRGTLAKNVRACHTRWRNLC